VYVDVDADVDVDASADERAESRCAVIYSTRMDVDPRYYIWRYDYYSRAPRTYSRCIAAVRCGTRGAIPREESDCATAQVASWL
jgi:hypothetical protein